MDDKTGGAVETKEKTIKIPNPAAKEKSAPQPVAAVAEQNPLGSAALQIREWRELGQDIVISLQDTLYVLRFTLDLYFSAEPVGDLRSRLAGQQLTEIEVEPVGLVPIQDGWKSWPVADFLGQFGVFAGGGRMLPWLSSAAAYQLLEEPLSEFAANEQALTDSILTRGLSPLMISQETDADLRRVYDFLNACAMEGVLQIAPPLQGNGASNPLSELMFQGHLEGDSPELEPLQKGLMNLLAALRRLERDPNNEF